MQRPEFPPWCSPHKQGEGRVVQVWAMYGVDGPIDRDELRTLHLDLRERIDGLVTVSELIQFREPKAFQDDLDRLWSRLGRLQRDGFRRAKWKIATGGADRPLDMSKMVSEVHDDDLPVLLRAWGWLERSNRGRVNMEWLRAEIEGQRFSCSAPLFGEKADGWNGIAMVGYLDGPGSSLLKGWCEAKDGETDWSGFGRHKVRPFNGTRVEVDAFLEASQGVSVRTIHDQLLRFARILAKLRGEAELPQRRPSGFYQATHAN